MIKKSGIIFFMVGFLAGAACFTFKIEPRPEPEQLVEMLVLCEGVIPDGELLAPQGITTEFSSKNPNVLCFVELKNVGRFITLKWRWYAPDGTLFKETMDVPVNENETYLEAVTAYDRLDIQIEDGFKGHWVVVILVDGELAGRRTFSVR